MNGSTLLAGAVLLAVGVAVGLLLGALRWRRPAAGPATGAELAGLLAPAASALQRVEQQLQDVERNRAGAYAGLTEQVGALHRASTELGAQARSLAGALRAPSVRGRWGELQLRRIVELAGMVEHCDFQTQVAGAGADDRAGTRPDLVVRLSGGRSIPVDAKVPLEAWLAAEAAADSPPDQDGAQRLRAAHSRAVRAHVDALAAKSYWDAVGPAPEFVVMFVPGEPLLDLAMQADPGLAEYAFSRKVVIATPTTLIALLRTVAFTWRQERLAASAEQIVELGRDLHRRLATVGGHLSALGRSLDRAVASYNTAIGSVESRLLVTARRFADLGPPDALHTLQPVDRIARSPAAPEWDTWPAGVTPDGPTPGEVGPDGPKLDRREATTASPAAAAHTEPAAGTVASTAAGRAAAPSAPETGDQPADAAQEWDERYGRSAYQATPPAA